MDFRILGALAGPAAGADVAVRGRSVRALLALLLMHGSNGVSTERLAEELWDGAPPATARATLQMHITALRRSLGAGVPLRTSPGGYVLELAADQLDAARFEQAVDQGRRAFEAGDAQEAAAQLRAGLDLWRNRAVRVHRLVRGQPRSPAAR